MPIQKLRKELNDLLESVVAHSESFSENRPISSLEISVVLAKITKMQESLAVLKFLLSNQEKELSTAKKAPKILNEIAINTININEATNTPETLPSYSNTNFDVKEQAKIKTQPEEIAQKLKKHTLKNLKEAFSLNDRYLYANELFNKNMEAFNLAIKTLDACINLAEANEEIKTLKTTFNWAEDNLYYIELIELIERRFS